MKNKFVFGILGLILSLTACSNETGEEKTTEEHIGKVFDTVTESSLSKYKEELLDLNSYDIINDESNEPSNDIIWSYMAISDKGYYYWKDSKDSTSLICFMDRVTGKSVPLCNRADCEHTERECNASFYTRAFASDGICFDSNRLFYYDGYVYVLAYDKLGQMYLYKLSEDGSEKTQYMKLYKKELTQPGNENHIEYGTPEICIHKEYVYYLIPKETVPTLYRMQLGTEKVEEVFKIETERPALYRMLAYGDFVFFQAGTYSEDYIDVDGGIFAYNVTNGEIKLVKEKVIATYKMNGVDLYYATSDGIYRMDMRGENNTKIVAIEKYPIFSVAGKYIYLKDRYDLKVYNEKGEYILTVKEGEGQSVSSIYYGDSDYIFASGSETVDDKKQSCIFYLDVSEIESGVVAWKHH